MLDLDRQRLQRECGGPRYQREMLDQNSTLLRYLVVPGSDTGYIRRGSTGGD
jgi:hypothetical protein